MWLCSKNIFISIYKIFLSHLNIKPLDNDCLFLAAVIWALIVRMPSTSDKKYN